MTTQVADIAARGIPGVYDMGDGLSRTIGAARVRVPGGRPTVGRGDEVELGERQRPSTSTSSSSTAYPSPPCPGTSART